MMLVRELVDCVNLCASWDLDLNSHVPLSDDVKDTECSFQHLLDNVFVFLIFVVIFTLFIFFVKKLGFDWFVFWGVLVRRVLVDAVCDVGCHTGAWWCVYSVDVVVEAALHAGDSLHLFQIFALPLLLNL